MKFYTLLIGQERTVPFDFQRIPSTDAGSSGNLRKNKQTKEIAFLSVALHVGAYF